MRKAILLLTVAALAAAGARFLPLNGSGADKGPKKAGVYTPDQAAANGVVEGRAPAVEVRAEQVGTVAVIHAREGDRVAKGGVLAVLNGDTQQAQVSVAEAEVAVAEAQLLCLVNGERPEKKKALAEAETAFKAVLDQAEARLKRAKAADDKGVSSRDQLDEALFALEKARAEYAKAKAERALIEAPAREDEVVSARARVAAAEARLRLAKAELARTRILAPADGTVLQRFAEPGDMAGPASARPVLVLADISRLRVRAFVEELDASRVRPGQPAVVTADGLPGQEFKGTVALVLPRMGRRGVESAAPGEYKDIYHREVLIDLDEGQVLPVSLRVRVRIDATVPGRPAAAPLPAPGGAGGPSEAGNSGEAGRVSNQQLEPVLRWLTPAAAPGGAVTAGAKSEGGGP